MLRITHRTPINNGLYATGSYTLAIARVVNGVPVLGRFETEHKFVPAPTDLDVVLSFPSIAQPDQGNGFYVEVNGVGTGSISLRGSTGQFPKPSVLDPIFGSGNASSIASMAGIIPGTEDALGRQNGYQIWMSLFNFFAEWDFRCKLDPSGYIMVFLNTKEAAFYQVLPTSFREVRTASKPMGFGYAIELMVLKEVDVTQPRADWIDWMNDTRSRIRRWQNLVNRSVLLASKIVRDMALGAIGSVFNPIQQTIQSMSAGVQSTVFTADMVNRMGINSVDRLREVAEQAFNEKSYAFDVNSSDIPRNSRIPGAMAGEFVPPTRSAMEDTYAGSADVVRDSLSAMSESAPSGMVASLNIDDPFYDMYADCLDFFVTSALIEDAAPLPEEDRAGRSGSMSRDIHRAARSGAAGLVEGRADEFASSRMSAETSMVTDTTLSLETRHPAVLDDSLKSFSLSYVAGRILPQWVASNDEALSPQLESFRRAFLGMSDPIAMSPLYRIVAVSESDTIYSLADKWLGSWERWAEIAFLNDLRPPYIAPQTGKYVRGPGDNLYIPTPGADVPISLLENILNVAKVHDLVTLQDLFLGFDLEVSASSGDLVWALYDYAHVAGPKAFQQEVSFVLGGGGGVTPDRFDAPSIRVGSKGAGKATVEVTRSLLYAWLSKDDRVSEVRRLSVVQDRDALYITVDLRFKNYDSTYTVAGAVRI